MEKEEREKEGQREEMKTEILFECMLRVCVYVFVFKDKKGVKKKKNKE
jgi:hypothetical protein